MSDDLDLDLPSEPVGPISHQVSDRFDYDVAYRFGFVGVGQGGGRLAETFHKLGYGRVGAINTSAEDLAGLTDDIPKLDLGTGGAGKDPARGRQVLEDAREDCRELVDRAMGDLPPDRLFVCAGLGGGTGSGGAAPLIQLCRDYLQAAGREPRVGAIVTLPEPHEGQRPCRNALQAFRQVCDLRPSPLLVIDNKRIGQLYRKGITEFYATCNTNVARLFHIFNRFAAAKSDLLSFDPADYATVLEGGLIALGASPIAKYQTKADITSSIREQLSKTVLAEVNLRQGTSAACLFMAPEAILSQLSSDYLGAGFDVFNRMLADNSVVHRGIYRAEIKELRCYTMVAGLPAPLARLDELAATAGTPHGFVGGQASQLGLDGP